MKRATFLLFVLVGFFVAVPQAQAHARIPAISCGSSGCWDIESFSTPSQTVESAEVQLTAQGSGLENISNGGDMGAVMLIMIEDSYGYFVQVGWAWNANVCGSGWNFYWRDNRPNGGNNVHCLGSAGNPAWADLDIDADGNTSNFFVSIYTSNGQDPCNACLSVNDATDMKVQYLAEVMYNGPNYTSSYPNHWYAGELQDTQSGQWYYDSSSGETQDFTGGAPPPNNKWMISSPYPTDDCIPWHLGTTQCATILAPAPAFPTPAGPSVTPASTSQAPVGPSSKPVG